MSIIIHGVFLFVLFLIIFWGLNSLAQLNDKLDQLPGMDTGVSRLLAQLRADRQSIHDEIEAARWQMDPMHQSLDSVKDRLGKLLQQYDKLLDIVEKNAVSRVDSRNGSNP